MEITQPAGAGSSNTDSLALHPETPVGTVNGTNRIFTVAHTPRAVVIDNMVYWGNGAGIAGVDDGYNYSGGVITCNSDRPPVSTIRSLY